MIGPFINLYYFEKTMKSAEKTKIHNVVILDQSSSMSCIKPGVISGFNEVLSGIVEAQQKYADTQEHYVTLTVFDNVMSYLHNRVAVDIVAPLTDVTYHPNGCTALYDAMGQTLLELEAHLDKEEDAVGIVTIITDGEENVSRRFSGREIYSIVERLKEKGWTFAFMGTNQDVMAVAKSLNIDHSRAFDYTAAGMHASARADRNAKMRMFEEFDGVYSATINMSKEERQRYRRDRAKANKYFEDEIQNSTIDSSSSTTADRITPDWINSLAPNEVFVFGSNLAGRHGGGAARIAADKFGAEMGVGVGRTGQTYAIPTMQGGVDTIRPYVDQFIEYAAEHPNLKFLVTRIGCGIAGFRDADIALLFAKCKDMHNVWLPHTFLRALAHNG